MAILKYEATGAPRGFSPIKGSVSTQVSKMAQQILKELYGKGFGAAKVVELNGIKYCFKLEKHWHPLDYKYGPKGDHQGITVYIESGAVKEPVKQTEKALKQESPREEIPNNSLSKARMNLLNKIDSILKLD